MMTEKQKESWKQVIFSSLIASLTVFVLYAFTQGGEGKKEVSSKLHELETKKASVEYVDKQDNSIKAEFNSKLDIIIQNQHEANNLLKEISNRR